MQNILFNYEPDQEEEDEVNFAAIKSIGGYRMGEVSSAFQKAIRRGDVEGALFWASELDLSGTPDMPVGYGAYAWKRMWEIASEDIGLAEPSLPATLKALHVRWLDAVKLLVAERKRDPTSKKRFGDRLVFVHAVMLLATAKKSRAVVHALHVYYLADRSLVKREVPDYALDMHTGVGRSKGRGVEHFIQEASVLVNEAEIEDPFKEPYEAYMRSQEKRRPREVKPEDS